MCTRYSIAAAHTSIEAEFQAAFTYSYTPVFNAGYGRDLPVIAGEGREISRMRWGLLPAWARAPEMRYRNLNAWAGDVVAGSLYRGPLRNRRCLIPANCFVVWIRKAGGARTPHVVYLPGQRTFSMAGLWDEWTDRNKGLCIRTFSLITTHACRALRPYSKTMPVIISPGQRHTYLKVTMPLHRITQMLRPDEHLRINLFPVSMAINDGTAEGRHLIQPVGQRLHKEYTYREHVVLKLEGMGSRKEKPGRNRHFGKAR